MRFAKGKIISLGVAIECPFCLEYLPNPYSSINPISDKTWLLDQLEEARGDYEGVMICPSCQNGIELK